MHQRPPSPALSRRRTVSVPPVPFESRRFARVPAVCAVTRRRRGVQLLNQIAQKYDICIRVFPDLGAEGEPCACHVTEPDRLACVSPLPVSPPSQQMPYHPRCVMRAAPP